MARKTCKECKYFQYPWEGNTHGHCYLNPPTVTFRSPTKVEHSEGLNIVSYSIRAQVGSSDISCSGFIQEL